MSASEDTGAGPSPSAPPDPFQEEQTVIILVGLIASGKVESAAPFDRMVSLIADPLYFTILLVYIRRGS